MIDQMTLPQSSKEILINQLFDALAPLFVLAPHDSANVGFTLAFYGAQFKGLAIANQAITLPASATSYVEADALTGAVTSNAAGYTVGRIRLGVAITSTTGMTSFVQEDRLFDRHNPLLAKSVAGGVNVTLTYTESGFDILECSGALTANISLILPLRQKQWTVFNNTTGAFTLTVKTPAGVGVIVAQTKRAIVYCNGVDVVRATADT